MAQTHGSTVAYLLTHYPQLAQTFVADEIRTLESNNIRILPISINPSAPEDLHPASSRAEAQRTLVIKSIPKFTVAWSLARLFVKRPAALWQVWRNAQQRTIGLKPRLWQTFHVIEAALVLSHCHKHGARHIHAHFGGTTATIARLVTELAGATGDSDFGWSFTIHGFQDFTNERNNELDRKAASAKFVVCVSDFTRSQLMRVSSPADWHKFRVIRCGIDLERFAFRPKQSLGDPPVVALVGRISPEKGHLVLLEALALLRDRDVAATVEFIGYGPYEAEVRSAAQRLGVMQHLRISGPTEPSAIGEALHRADIFCLPSFAEGLPVSLMEAMATGTPVITTYISGIPELALNGESALVVPAGNASALADGLARLIADDELRSRLVARGRELVEARHTLDRSVGELKAELARVGAI